MWNCSLTRARHARVDRVDLVVGERPVVGLERQPPRKAPPSVREAEDVEQHRAPAAAAPPRSRIAASTVRSRDVLVRAENEGHVALDRGKPRQRLVRGVGRPRLPGERVERRAPPRTPARRCRTRPRAGRDLTELREHRCRRLPTSAPWRSASKPASVPPAPARGAHAEGAAARAPPGPWRRNVDGLGGPVPRRIARARRSARS